MVSEQLLFLALLPNICAKTVKARLEDHAVIHVMKTQVMPFFTLKKVKEIYIYNEQLVHVEATLLVFESN